MSSQNGSVWAASVTDTRPAFCAATMSAAVCLGPVAPSSSRPMPSQRNDQRQPYVYVILAASGTNTSWPADMPPAASPMAMPRCFSNQRATMAEPVLSAAPPAPTAMSTPAVTKSCQSWVTNADAMEPTPSSISASTMTRAGPQRSASRPANGPAAPSNNSPTAAAVESAPRLQCISTSIGLMYTPKTERTPVEASMQNVRAARTTQAGWSRRADVMAFR